MKWLVDVLFSPLNPLMACAWIDVIFVPIAVFWILVLFFDWLKSKGSKKKPS